MDKGVFSPCGAGTIRPPNAINDNNNLDPYLIPYTKSKSKQITNLNIKPNTTELLGDLCDLC